MSPKRRLVGNAVVLAICSLLFPLSAGSAEPRQDQKHYEEAFHNQSTSPSYVLVTIVDDRTGESHTGCVEANFILGAITREQNFAREPRQNTLNNPDHVFHFSTQEALDNVRLRYTESELEQARALVRGTVPSNPFDPAQVLLSNLRNSDALACAFIEQGLTARRADRSGTIYSEP